jgi:LPXTG-motif cell wall-anchored protein
VLGEFNKSGVKVNIKNKSFAAPELAVIGNQLTVILVLLALIPAALLIMGGVVWYRRKNR